MPLVAPLLPPPEAGRSSSKLTRDANAPPRETPAQTPPRRRRGPRVSARMRPAPRVLLVAVLRIPSVKLVHNARARPKPL